MANERRSSSEEDSQETTEAESVEAAEPTVEEGVPAKRLHPQFADTPEFAAAVNEAVAEQLKNAVPAILAQLAAAQGEGQTAPALPNGADGAWARGLALAIAEVAGQGTGKIYVDPQVLEVRKAATERMKGSIIALHAKAKGWDGDEEDNPFVPVYKLVSNVFLPMGADGEVLIEPLYRGNDRIVYPMEIAWSGVPNLAMSPINDAASEVFTAFCESIGHAVSPEPDALVAVTTNGAVVRGAAAQAVLRSERGPRELGQPGGDPADGPAARLRRRDPAPKQMVKVLGTIAKPVEVS